ncbi:MAG TPA: ABC transporter permease [Dehalococcoidia bacterium]|nr:ABC transporter permease [Dehalococcoidia bacterium]
MRPDASPSAIEGPGSGEAGQSRAFNPAAARSLGRDVSGIGRSVGHLRRWATPILILIAWLAAWEAWTQLGDVPKWQLPGPLDIAQELVESRGLLWEHTRVTLLEVVLGFLAALIVGLFLANAIAYSRIVERSIYPIVIASQTIPIIAIAPLLLIWVGYGIAPKIIVVALICFFPISVNTVDGLRSVDPDMVNMMRTLGGSRWQVFTKLQVPSSLPQMFSGIKIGITFSVIGAVIGEWVGASAGLGYLMTYSQPLFLTARVFAAIVVLSVMGIGLFGLATLVERLTLPWYHDQKRARSLERV